MSIGIKVRNINRTHPKNLQPTSLIAYTSVCVHIPLLSFISVSDSLKTPIIF